MRTINDLCLQKESKEGTNNKRRPQKNMCLISTSDIQLMRKYFKQYKLAKREARHPPKVRYLVINREKENKEDGQYFGEYVRA